MMVSTRFTLIAALLLLAACRSDPIHFHTLTPMQVGSTTPGNGAQILIEGISVPPQVDRAQIVIRQGNSGLAILETEWWGASLADELRSALADQLANARPQHNVSLRVDVQRFDSIPGQYGLIDVTWRLRTLGDSSAPTLSCRSLLQTPSGAAIDDLVIAQQHNVQRLSALIAQAAGGTQTGCPSSR
ncbi:MULTISPECIES: PqiC family protein [unclassified Pseudomonas]|uniref:PqiC family protein n=1 Tax=unclassified Pseudomonas TaxID=196821 RepID=UPI002AC96E59|nr:MULTISPECIES: PqiC family protein [unclassified Pseudomonas]MEB0045199.1 PqiC family protein [Pseudomonas sp. Dout3]MEB0096445.1 PqiC family protein [Pseudomonas sp. DC1.2]WPX61398.1 PqiC family protein [Pseudomonas sp. DC1.2]